MDPILLSPMTAETSSSSDEAEETSTTSEVPYPKWFDQSMVYNVKLGRSHAVPEYDEHVNLYYKFKNGHLEEVFCCISRYADNEILSHDPIKFHQHEFDFMISSITAILTTRRRLPPAIARFGERILTVRRESVENRTIVQPGCGNLFDLLPFKTIIVVEINQGCYVTIREFELKTAYALLDALKNVVFIAKYAATADKGYFVNVFYGLAMLRILEPDTSNWPKLVKGLLSSTWGVLEMLLNRMFDDEREMVDKQFDRIFKAFNATPQTFSPPTPPKNTKEALPIIRACLAVEEVWTDRFFLQLF